MPRRARKALGEAAADGDKVKIRLTATATDDLGDSTEVTGKAKRKPKK